MANKDNLIKYVTQKIGVDKLNQLVQQIEQQVVQDPDFNPQAIADVLQGLEHVVTNPEDYQAVLSDAIQSGAVDEGMMPPNFDPVFVAVLLLVFRELKKKYPAQNLPQQPQMFARGGLTVLANKGRGGDTMLAHINPREAEVLRRMGGTGKINPLSGLPEFKGGFIGKVLKIAAPIAAGIFLGPGAAALAGAASGASGGGGIKGALMGGALGFLGAGGGAGVAGSLGKAATGILPESFGSYLTNSLGHQAIGAGLLGAGIGAAGGANPLKTGLLTGASAYFTPQIQGGLGIGESAAAQTAGLTGAQTSSLNNLGTSLMPAPIGAPYAPSTGGLGALGGLNPGATVSELANTAASTAAKAGSGLFGNTSTLTKGLMLSSLIGGKTPQQAQQAIAGSNLSEAQKEALSRELTNYSASWNATTLPTEGTPEHDDMMQQIYQGKGQTFLQPQVVKMARGGALGYLNGGMSGRTDNIPAKLSPGEYVLDAETVAMLGDGNSKAGARKLDEMRKNIRQQKGKALAKGKFSPNAKAPLSYLRGN
jgi:hypothetical protein